MPATLHPAAAADAREEERTLRLNLSEDPQTTNPFVFSGLTTYNVLSQAYEGFTALAPDGSVIPALAVSWQTPDGGLTWRFVLRPGVRFHSGRELSAEDVGWTFLQLLKPRTQPSFGAYWLRRVVGAHEVEDGKAAELAGVTVVDRYTVEVRFTEPNALFPLAPLFIVDSGIEAEFGADWMNRTSAGTGPFRLTAWRRTQEVVLAAHRDYWGGAPLVGSVRLAIIPSAETLLALFNSGRLDFAVMSDSGLRTVLSDSRYADRRTTYPRCQSRYLGLNQGLYPPFRDIRVREAMILALDRGSVARILYQGAASVADGAIPPGLAGYRADNSPPIPYDPARARHLIAEAGYDQQHPPPPLELAAPANARDEMTVYATQLSAVLGIQVGITILDRAALVSATNQGKLPFFLSGWTADYSDATGILAPVWSGSSPYNRSRWRNPGFDRVIDQAMATPDADHRHALAQEAERLLMNDRAMVPLPIPMMVALVRQGVTGVRLTCAGFFDLRAAALP